MREHDLLVVENLVVVLDNNLRRPFRHVGVHVETQSEVEVLVSDLSIDMEAAIKAAIVVARAKLVWIGSTVSFSGDERANVQRVVMVVVVIVVIGSRGVWQQDRQRHRGQKEQREYQRG